MKITGIPQTPVLATEAASTIYGKSILSVGVGSILMFGGTSTKVPDGFLICDGSEKSRNEYPDLFNFYNSLTPPLPYGSGNGTSTFNLPNMKGKIPIGVGTNVSTLGATGGALNHTHTMGDHVHTQSHTHTMAHVHTMAHSHTIDHKHLVGDATNNHSHNMDHIHWVPAHYHAASGSASGANHDHNVFVSGATAAGSSGVRGGTNASGTYTYNTRAATDWSATTGGSIGNTASRNGNNGFWSSSAQNETTSGNVTSTTYSSSYTGSTNGTVATTLTKTGNSSSANTDPHTSTTGGMTTTPSVTPSNPAILTVNFIVKV